MKNILVVGSLNMDYTIYVNEFPKPSETLLGESRFIQPGGKGANQAVAVAKSGLANCIFRASKGNDADGDIITNALAKYGVKAILKQSEKETGNATIIVDKTSENKIIIVAGANGDLLAKDIDEKLIEQADYVVLQNEIPEQTNKKVMELAHKLGKVVIYNPAPFRNIDKSIFKYVDFFVPNEIELSQYSNEKDIKKGALKMIDLGVKNLIITLGTKGSMFFNKNENFTVDAFKVKAVDTVAAGDTFVGYFTSALASGLEIKEAMRLASKASSITVTRKGSIVSIPEGKEVKI